MASVSVGKRTRDSIVCSNPEIVYERTFIERHFAAFSTLRQLIIPYQTMLQPVYLTLEIDKKNDRLIEARDVLLSILHPSF
mgnify:CR=1 FL=1